MSQIFNNLNLLPLDKEIFTHQIVDLKRGTNIITLTDYTDYCGGAHLSLLEGKKEEFVEILQLVLDYLLKLNVNFVTYIVRSDHIHIQEALEEVGFKKLQEFRNANTGNLCQLWTKI